MRVWSHLNGPEPGLPGLLTIRMRQLVTGVSR